MGNTISQPSHNFYITRVTNRNLPLVPFIHTLVAYNNTPVKENNPTILREILATQDLTLDVLDIVLNERFKITIPRMIDTSEKLGITLVDLSIFPVPLNIKVTAVSESATHSLKSGDNIIGIEGIFVESEDELIFRMKTEERSRLVVLRDSQAIIVEVSGNQNLGCEIHSGLFHKIKKCEYLGEDYNGTIKKIKETANLPEDESRHGEISEFPSQQFDDHLPAMESVGSMCEDTGSYISEHDENQSINDSVCAQSNEFIANDPINSQAMVNQPVGTTNELPDRMLPQIPSRTGTVLNKDRTDSYVYKSPSAIPKNETIEAIYNEAGVSNESEFFKGKKHDAVETASLIDSALVSKNDFVLDQQSGTSLMKQEAFDERKKMFEEQESDDSLPFETRKKDNIEL